MKLFKDYEVIPSSFRDPSGFVFSKNDKIYRTIRKSYQENYDLLIKSGLYDILIEKKLLIPHIEIDEFEIQDDVYKIIQPEKIPFISYPYEWSFSQIKDAAITTIEIQKTGLEYGLVLKDCSAFNIQFKDGKPILIDTLSFEKYEEGQIWKGYKQFCQHFLAPLALMAHRDVRLNQLARIFLDGISLDLVGSLLPARTRLMFSLLSHIHAHAKSQKHFESKKVEIKNRKLPKRSFVGLIESLHSAIKKQNWKADKTEWANYYGDTNYSETAFEQKKQLVSDFLDEIKPETVWDLGANTGIFSKIASSKGIQTISFDNDPAAVEKNYLECKSRNDTKILPLLLDLTNPTPNIGWGNKERMSFMDRSPCDTVLALALIHHLVISNNLPLEKISEFFKTICKNLIIEFVPKSDSQVQRLLFSREDIFDNYTIENFENEFKKNFKIQKKILINDSERILFLMEKNE